MQNLKLQHKCCIDCKMASNNSKLVKGPLSLQIKGQNCCNVSILAPTLG